MSGGVPFSGRAWFCEHCGRHTFLILKVGLADGLTVIGRCREDVEFGACPNCGSLDLVLEDLTLSGDGRILDAEVAYKGRLYRDAPPDKLAELERFERRMLRGAGP